MEPFKNLVGAELVRTIAAHLTRVHGDFPRRSFVRRATAGLDELELKARVAHVADALAAALPEAFADAADVLERALAPATTDTDLSRLVPGEHGLAGWAIWPLCDFVARYGLAHPDRSLAALYQLTQRHTAEYAIRPFLIEHEARTMKLLRRWARDPNPHVRRLVSEGTRPRLPWGVQLKRFVADPSPTLPLLERLQDDGSEYVRRSVANHLNDIAKDHPGVVADWLERHYEAGSDERRRALRHASRTLVKQGDRRVLKVFGLATPLRGAASFALEPTKVAVGGAVTLDVELRSTAKAPQRLVVDYVVHHVKQDGRASPKTWKGWRLELAAGEARRLQKRHSLKPVTTRRYHAGEHRVDLLVNGAVVASSAFTLRA